MLQAVLALALSYLLGSVPFGFLMVRFLKGEDLRSIGSGNIGATNAMRALGRPLGIVAFLLDFAKGFVPVGLIAPALSAEWATGHNWLAVGCGAAAVLGHVFPVFLRFRGGKGVATGCGAIVGLDPWIFLIAGLAWIATLAATRFVGLASMVMGIVFPIVAAIRAGFRDGPEVVLAAGALAALILMRHRSNLMRMIDGTEPKIGRKAPPGGVA
jgi:glycerol-3-phosphate acyltransferase PlsY